MLKKLIEAVSVVESSNLQIKWRSPSPSAIAYFKKIGLKGKDYSEAEVEQHDGTEIWYVKVDGKRYVVDSDNNSYEEK